MARCLPVDPSCPVPGAVYEAVEILRRGGVVAYPTDTVYGLAVDAMNPQAIARLYRVKQRPAAKAIPVIIGELEQLSGVVMTPTPTATQLIAAFWPGPLTLVMIPAPQVPTPLLGATRRVGVRWPHDSLGGALALGLGRAVTATSANLSGASVALSAAEVAAQLGSVVDLILDGGTIRSAEVSTVLDVAVEPPRLYRAGKIPLARLESVLGRALEAATGAAPAQAESSPSAEKG